MAEVIKIFNIEEGATPNGRYRITVTYNGKVVDIFSRNTMFAAQSALIAAGYQRLVWARGERVILQEQER